MRSVTKKIEHKRADPTNRENSTFIVPINFRKNIQTRYVITPHTATFINSNFPIILFKRSLFWIDLIINTANSQATALRAAPVGPKCGIKHRLAIMATNRPTPFNEDKIFSYSLEAM